MEDDYTPAERALLAAGGGWYVFPVNPTTKQPLIADWVNQSTRDLDVVETWFYDTFPNAYPAIVPGKSGRTVIDVDQHPDKPNGYDSFDALGLDFPAFAGLSKSEMGEHLYYRGASSSVNGVYPGIDRKSVGGYVMLAYQVPQVAAITDKLPPEFRSLTPDARGAAKRDVIRWLQEHDDDIRTGPMEDLLDDVPWPFRGHDLMRDLVFTVVNYGDEGLHGATAALKELRDLWMEATHGEDDPEKEFDAAVSGAIQKSTDRRMYLPTKAPLPDVEGTDDDGMPMWLKAIGGESLQDALDAEIDEVDWVVEDLIAPGLNGIAAPPKAGKTFFALGIATAVATGHTLMGKAKVGRKRRVLYLSMENSKRQMARNLMTMGVLGARGIDILYGTPKSDPHKIISQWYEVYPDGLVVVDTYIRIKQIGGEGNAYENEAQYMQSLRDLIPDGGSMLLVHHVRKSRDEEDRFNDISGSQAFFATVDNMLMLTRKGTDGKIYARGRDFDGDVELIFETRKGLWILTQVISADDLTNLDIRTNLSKRESDDDGSDDPLSDGDGTG